MKKISWIRKLATIFSSLGISLIFIGSFSGLKTLTISTNRSAVYKNTQLTQHFFDLKTTSFGKTNDYAGGKAGVENNKENCEISKPTNTQNSCWLKAELEEINQDLDKLEWNFEIAKERWENVQKKIEGTTNVHEIPWELIAFFEALWGPYKRP